jgi:hypothetical protein
VSHRSTTTRRTPPEHHRAATEVPRNSGHPRHLSTIDLVLAYPPEDCGLTKLDAGRHLGHALAVAYLVNDHRTKLRCIRTGHEVLPRGSSHQSHKVSPGSGGHIKWLSNRDPLTYGWPVAGGSTLLVPRQPRHIAFRTSRQAERVGHLGRDLLADKTARRTAKGPPDRRQEVLRILRSAPGKG